MKKLQIAGFSALTLLGSMSAMHAQATTPPVGYVTIDIKGHGGTATQATTVPRISLTGAQDHSNSTSVFTSDGSVAHVLTDSSASFAGGDYMNGSEISHYIEITSGTDAGTISWIIGSPGGTTLETNDDLSLVADNSSYSIRKAFTIPEIFGAVPTGLGGGSSSASADGVLLFDTVSKNFITFWYKSTGLGGTGWRCTDGSITNPSSYALFPTDGMIILRKQASDTSFTVTGSVKLTATQTLIEPDGFNLLSPLIPVEYLTPTNSGLYTGIDTTGIAGGSSAASADSLMIYDTVKKSFTTFWYKSSGLGGTGWRCTDPDITTPASYAFPTNSAIILDRKGNTSFTWTMPAITVSN